MVFDFQGRMYSTNTLPKKPRFCLLQSRWRCNTAGKEFLYSIFFVGRWMSLKYALLCLFLFDVHIILIIFDQYIYIYICILCTGTFHPGCQIDDIEGAIFTNPWKHGGVRHQQSTKICPTVDGSEILHPLTWRIYPFSIDLIGFHTSQVVQDFFHQ